ncbi:MAG: GntR family transcriptional regulator [Cyclobacteriaceae bacterium]|nr:GntR family transcriptional regulator [Cyclobacteriaceae bacterium]
MLKITLNSPVPIYTQLCDGIKAMVQSGELQPNDALPSIRSLSAQLDVASNTVARAYMELERAGVIISNGRKGSYISPKAPVQDKATMKIFKGPLRELIAQGMGQDEIIRIFNQNLKEIFD